MTAHDPRVTLTDLREQVGALCPQCNHRAIWHHDERGCQYHGNGENGCPCALDSDRAVEQIIAARLAPIRGLLERWESAEPSTPAGFYPEATEHARGYDSGRECCADDLRAALDAPQDAPRGPGGGEQGAEVAGGRSEGCCTPCETCGGEQARGWHNHLVHNHRPWQPMCAERYVGGQLRGACLNDDGTPR